MSVPKMVIAQQFPLTLPFCGEFAWLRLQALSHSSSEHEHDDSESQTTNTTLGASWENLLPAACLQHEFTFYQPQHCHIDWLYEVFTLKRLEDIYSCLWMAGKPRPPRSLLHQRSIGREIVIIQQMDMHLLWEFKRLYLHPIPSYVFSSNFWDMLIGCNAADCKSTTSRTTSGFKRILRSTRTEDTCKHRQIYASAMGLLYSYIALIRTDMDFRIAHDAGLLPDKMSWCDWKLFVSTFLKSLDNPSNSSKGVHHRFFFYGELRLSRLNEIYAVTFRDFRGYRNNYQQYGDFIKLYLHSIAVFVGYVVLALTAMQVGLANQYLIPNDLFQRASYYFTIFSMVGLLAFLGVLLVILVPLILFNAYNAFNFRREVRTEHNCSG